MTADMRTSWLSVIAASAACGDSPASQGEPLGPSAELAIVAHQADDLWFMQPDLSDAVQRGAGVTIVYVTAGDREDGAPTTTARYDGATAAYAAIAGVTTAAWSCGPIEIAGHRAQHCRLAAASLSLIFLGYPDGGKDGAAAGSLLNLWEAKVGTVPAIGQGGATYNQRGLIATLAEIIDTAAPTTLRTLEIAATHGDDHSDHMIAGALAVLATAASSASPALIAYRGDNIASEAANIPAATSDRSTDIIARYAACTTGCGRCGEPCAADQLAGALPGAQLAWLSRRYPVTMRPTAGGLLRFADGCVTATTAGDNATIVDCATAATWQLGSDGTLRTSGGAAPGSPRDLRASSELCLDAILTGEIVAGPCTGAGPGGRYFLDDEGHLWSGVVPAPQSDMAFAHVDCVISTGGRPRAALCGAARAPTVQLPGVTAVIPGTLADRIHEAQRLAPRPN
jgi:LmbE family N-acetylglucosaminyl deacetylase